MLDFSKEVVIVTGAAGSLGGAVAQAFFDAGARLALVDLSNDGLRTAYSDWTHDDRILLVPTNLADETATQSMVERTKEHFGQLDVLANIAGGFGMGPQVHETTVEEWERMLDMNTRSMYLACRASVPVMLDQGSGRIVSVAARAAEQGKAKMGPYCVSKRAVMTLTESLAAEHKLDNINVNCVLPGTIDTPANRQDMPDADHDKWVPTKDLADVILFLASPLARSVNGAAVPVYGRS